MKVHLIKSIPILEAANDQPQPMTRAVREMLHALCRLTGQPFQPAQSQDVALAQIDILRDQIASRRQV